MLYFFFMFFYLKDVKLKKAFFNNSKYHYSEKKKNQKYRIKEWGRHDKRDYCIKWYAFVKVCALSKCHIEYVEAYFD